MNTCLNYLACLAVLGSLASTPARADDFLTELAKTDGDVLGENARPETPSGSVRASSEHLAFVHELSRSDGDTAPAREEEGSDTVVASR